MSLLVWLPLNGDLHNLGLYKYPITIFRGTETYNDQGKIGKCFYSNGVNTIKVSDIIPDFLAYTSYSLCAWFYIETNNTTHSGSAIISAGDWNNQVLNLSLSDWSTDHYTRLRVSGTNWNNYYNYNFNKNTWYHVVVCSDGNKTYAYVNGNLIGNTIVGFLPSNISGNDLCIGGATYYNGMLFFGKINDVRIYDHCLSAEEVEEISKGLILHYKLDNNGMGNENLVNSPITWTELNTKANFNTILTSTTNFGLLAGENFTFSVDIKVPTTIKKARARILFYNSSSDRTGPTGTTYITDGEGRIYVSGTVLANYSRMELLIDWNASSDITTTNVPCYYKNIKLERGTNATVWCPYDNSNIVYDSSGYDNNGTIVGSLETTTPSSRYSCATSFDNKEYIIHKLPENMYQATYSFWVKASSYTSYGGIYMPYQSPSAGTSPWFAINTESCKVWAYFGNNSPNYTKGSGTMPLNEWHHCVYVWNNGVALWYVDGEKNGNSVTYTGRTFILNTANATIGNSYTGTSWNGTPFTGEISDFRVYATALTEAQIKELYKTSMIVNGTLVTARDLE